MKKILLLFLLYAPVVALAQSTFNLSRYKPTAGVSVSVHNKLLTLQWPAGANQSGKMVFDLQDNRALLKSIDMINAGIIKHIGASLDPAFILTIGKRDLISQNGWNIFFDKVPKKPHQSYTVNYKKQGGSVITQGAHTIVRLPGLSASTFKGYLEFTVYNGSPLINIAAVVITNHDSTAIVYDAGLVSKRLLWKQVSWAGTDDKLKSAAVTRQDSSTNLAVKYRTIMAAGGQGSIAVFPAPHQYFYPLDEAFNLKFTWYGNNYRNMLPGYGIGIRQELEGDKRFVPWFNAPPGTQQRLNFFCLLGSGSTAQLLSQVKRFTHNDKYQPLPGYKTMQSHFHNEFVMKVVLAGKQVPENPNFVKVFKNTGVDIVHLAEFHYTAHPKGPDDKRLLELKTLFEQCRRLSNNKFLLLPGEEPNEFFGGHWLAFFPKPVYWVMSRKANIPFLTTDPKLGKIYHIGDKEDMMHLLQEENGLVWTAHARTKGSTGYPDKYKDEPFFKSDHFMGAAWKAMPADLSEPRLGKRVLDLMDDMNNWGLRKHVIGEADLFTIEPENEMYAHLNVNYLQLDKLPEFDKGWKPVLDVMQQGRFFTTTGEVLIPAFQINGSGPGQTIKLKAKGTAQIDLALNWTFPLNFVEIISGDGEKTFRKRVDMTNTKAFGTQSFTFSMDLKKRKWVRIEAWDVAANGAFTQTMWIEN